MCRLLSNTAFPNTSNGLIQAIGLRSKRSQMFFKIGVLKSFENFTRKHMRWSLFKQSYRPSDLKYIFLQNTCGACL